MALTGRGLSKEEVIVLNLHDPGIGRVHRQVDFHKNMKSTTKLAGNLDGRGATGWKIHNLGGAIWALDRWDRPPNLLYYRRKSELHDKTEETLNRLQGVHFVIGEALRINFVKQVA